MAQVEVHMLGGGSVDVQTMPDADAMALVEAWQDGDEFLALNLDDGAVVSHIAAAHVARIDVGLLGGVADDDRR